MDIIKTGNKLVKQRRKRCQNCGTRFVFSLVECEQQSVSGGWKANYVKCPICHTHILVNYV